MFVVAAVLGWPAGVSVVRCPVFVAVVPVVLEAVVCVKMWLILVDGIAVGLV